MRRLRAESLSDFNPTPGGPLTRDRISASQRPHVQSTGAFFWHFDSAADSRMDPRHRSGFEVVDLGRDMGVD